MTNEHTPRLPLDGHEQAEFGLSFDEINGANMDAPPTVNIPHRLAAEIQEYLQTFADTCEYHLGLAERRDMADEYVEHHLQHEVSPSSLAWDALKQWRRHYAQQ